VHDSVGMAQTLQLAHVQEFIPIALPELWRGNVVFVQVAERAVLRTKKFDRNGCKN